MKGEFAGSCRLRVGDYRAIFKLVECAGESLLLVTNIGPRGGIYG